MKKFLPILLFSIMTLTLVNVAFADVLVTMYAADGRTQQINSLEVEAYKSVGWYTERPVPMYAADGRTLYMVPSEVEAYEAVGWSKTEPKKVPMYSSDGRTIYVLESQVDAYKNVG